MSRLSRYSLAAVVTAILLSSAPALAQSRACVQLLVGAGYAAEMRIVSDKFHTDWSSSFAIGSTVCQPLDGVGDGMKFSVEVKAILGKTVTCKPSDAVRVAASKSSVTFQAWGTTLNVKCEEPGISENADRDTAARTPSADGKKAEKSLKSK
jgi:hypothetical protein